MLNVTIKDVKIKMNSQAILAPAEKFTNKLLKQFGAYVRTGARRSIKYANRKRQNSRPGEPPMAHRGKFSYRDTIFFLADPKTKSVVIGGVLLSGTAANGQAVPGILEHGGVSIFARKNKKGQRVKASAQILARPHMNPAFQAAIKKFLPDLIRGGIMREV